MGGLRPFQGRESQFCSLDTRAAGPEGSGEPPSTSRKVRPDPGLRACPDKPPLVFADSRSTYRKGWAAKGPSSQTQFLSRGLWVRENKWVHSNFCSSFSKAVKSL